MKHVYLLVLFAVVMLLALPPIIVEDAKALVSSECIVEGGGSLSGGDIFSFDVTIEGGEEVGFVEHSINCDSTGCHAKFIGVPTTLLCFQNGGFLGVVLGVGYWTIEGDVTGAYDGLCNVYCNVLACDSDAPRGSDKACDKIYDKHAELAGHGPICEVCSEDSEFVNTFAMVGHDYTVDDYEITIDQSGRLVYETAGVVVTGGFTVTLP